MGEESLVAGADVCFDPNTTPHIVFAHIMAMLRRFELYDNYDRTEYSKSILYRGNLVIDPWRQRVTLDGLEVTLRPREFRLLTYMAKNPGIVLTPSMLSAPTGHISDKTAYIMMRYQDEVDEANEELNGKVAAQLWELEQRQDRLRFYVSLLEPKQEGVIKLHYFEGKSRDEVCEQLDISSSTYDKTRKKGVDRLVEMYEMTTGLRND